MIRLIKIPFRALADRVDKWVRQFLPVLFEDPGDYTVNYLVHLEQRVAQLEAQNRDQKSSQ